MNILYGFYLMIITIVLFFSAHFIQYYYFDLPEKEKRLTKKTVIQKKGY